MCRFFCVAVVIMLKTTYIMYLHYCCKSIQNISLVTLSQSVTPRQHVWVCVQMGTLGAGNHYAEIQVVEEVFDKPAARKMGIDKVGQVCIMIHSGSRGLGHQVKPHYTLCRFL